MKATTVLLIKRESSYQNKTYMNGEKDRSSHRRCFVKKVFIEILQNAQENTCARVFSLIKLQAPPANLLKKDSGTGVFL